MMTENKDYSRDEVTLALLKVCDALARERYLLTTDIITNEKFKVENTQARTYLLILIKKDKDRVQHIDNLIYSNKSMLCKFLDKYKNEDSDYLCYYDTKFPYLESFFAGLNVQGLLNNKDLIKWLESHETMDALKIQLKRFK